MYMYLRLFCGFIGLFYKVHMHAFCGSFLRTCVSGSIAEFVGLFCGLHVDEFCGSFILGSLAACIGPFCRIYRALLQDL